MTASTLSDLRRSVVSRLRPPIRRASTRALAELSQRPALLERLRPVLPDRLCPRPPRPVDGADARPHTAGDLDAAPTIDLDVARPVYARPGRGGSLTLGDGDIESPRALRRTLSRARRASHVIAPADWAVDAAGASALVHLAAAGAPLTLDRPLGSPSRLGTAFAAVLTEPAGDDPALRSARLRRAALADHGPRAGRERVASHGPAMSVLLPTMRPADVLSAVDRIARQTEVRAQLVVGLHGDGFPDSIEAEIVERVGDDAIVTRHPTSATLGEILRTLSERADGGLVAKWDDDDWYGDHHLLDLALAADYSGADVVGKFAEFVYLEESDLTIRRSDVGAETYGATLSGGALLVRADWLAEIGGWTTEPRNVDWLLIDATRRAGGSTYRTHGFEYVLRRRATGGHTWSADDEYFLADAIARSDGLDLAAAGIETP